MAEFEKTSAEQPKPTNYRWDPTDKFILTGLEFDLIYNGLRANLNDPNFIRVASIVKALETVDGVFKQGVEAGVIKPVYPEPKEEQKLLKDDSMEDGTKAGGLYIPKD